MKITKEEHCNYNDKTIQDNTPLPTTLSNGRGLLLLLELISNPFESSHESFDFLFSLFLIVIEDNSLSHRWESSSAYPHTPSNN